MKYKLFKKDRRQNRTYKKMLWLLRCGRYAVACYERQGGLLLLVKVLRCLTTLLPPLLSTGGRSI